MLKTAIKRNLTLPLLLGCACFIGSAANLQAQSVAGGSTGAGPANPQEGESPGEVQAGPERVIVTDVPIEQSILPTTRPYTSAFGLDSNILDVPRNVTIISREQLDAISIRDVRDFSKLTSSSYTTSNFGAPANPSIRGFSADVFVNGQRRGLTSNGNGLPINFNAVESVSFFKGPATVIYGASQYVGGYIDLVTKRPYFDKFQGDVSATVGMYDQYRWTLDFGGPIIKDKLAYRISYSGEESGSFYENGNLDTQAIYGAVTWTPTANYRLDFNTEYYQADYVENFGINRVTQDLIDNNRYITGFVVDQNGDGVRDSFDVNSNSNNVLPTGTIDLNRSRRLLAPGDGSFGRQLSAQVIQTLTLDENYSIVDNLYFNYIKRDTRSSYYYSEVIDNAYVIDNRTEFKGKIEGNIGGSEGSAVLSGKDKDAKKSVIEPKKGISILDQFNAGIDIRYQHVLAYDDYFNEPANAWDLSAPRAQIQYRYANTALPIPGHRDRYAFPGTINGDTGDSNAVIGGVYVQNELRVAEKFGLLTGARVDLIYVHFRDPITFGGGTDTGDETIMAQPNFNISPTYRITDKLSAYFTYNYSQSSSVGNGGGYVATGGNFDSADFHRESNLYEGGLKGSFLKDTLFVSSAGFFQTRSIPTIGGASNDVEIYGFEIEANYQPNKNFYATVGYTLSESFLRNQSPFSVQPLSFDRLPVNPDGTRTTDNAGLGALPIGDYRQPGLPEHLINALASYKTDFGLGASIGAVVTGPIHNDYAGYLRIPWQYTLDVTAFYTYKNVEARVAFLNVTDQDNFSPPNAVYGADSIVRDLPLRIEGTVRIRF
jgi:hypothetical protein